MLVFMLSEVDAVPYQSLQRAPGAIVKVSAHTDIWSNL